MDNTSGLFKLPEPEGGIFKLPEPDKCLDASHYPPTHLNIPAGFGYKHVCPKCGETRILKNNITYQARG